MFLARFNLFSQNIAEHFCIASQPATKTLEHTEHIRAGPVRIETRQQEATIQVSYGYSHFQISKSAKLHVRS